MIVMGDDLRHDIRLRYPTRLARGVDAELLAAAIVGVAFEVANVMRQRKHTDVNSAARFCSELILRGGRFPPCDGGRSLLGPAFEPERGQPLTICGL